MSTRKIAGRIALAVALLIAPCTPLLAKPACLHLWLIPFEPAAADMATPNEDWAASLTGGKVRILNYEPAYLDDIQSTSREFVEDVGRKIGGQRTTVAVLDAFAREHDCPVSLRYLQWATLFEELERALLGKSSDLPDVVQIGSSWAAYFAEKGLLGTVDRGGSAAMEWREVEYPRQRANYCLRWTVDYRFLYYWKRRPSTHAADDAETALDPTSWESLIESLTDPSPGNWPGALVIPIDSYGANSMHYYAPFVWGGGGSFFNPDEPRVDLASPRALSVPTLLAQAAHRHPTRLLFPERSHPESDLDFVRGRYRATVSTLNLAHHWYSQFKPSAASARGRFDDFAGVALPPSSFKGGSDLALTRWAEPRGRRNVAQALMHRLATDASLQEELVRSGDWPAQSAGGDVRSLLHRTWLDCRGSCDRFLEALATAIESARAPRVREYPSHPAFGRDMEDQVVRGAFLSVWREMGRYSKGQADAASLERTALMAQDLINDRIMGWPARARQWSARNGGALFVLSLLVLGAATAATLLAVRGARRSRRQVATIQQLQVVAATTVRSLDQQHISLRGPARLAKRSIVNEALLAWLHAQQFSPRLRDKLEPVVCRAVVLAAARIRSGTHSPSELAAAWEAHAGSADMAAKLNGFLAANGVAVDVRLDGFAQAHEVDFPYLLEQALVCLTENALQGALKRPHATAVRIRFDPSTHELSLESPTRLDPRIAALINGPGDAEAFCREVRALNRLADLHDSLGEEIRNLRRSLPHLGPHEQERIDRIEDDLEALYRASNVQWQLLASGAESAAARLEHLDHLARSLPRVEVGVGLVEIKMIAASFFDSLRVLPGDGMCVFVLRLRLGGAVA